MIGKPIKFGKRGKEKGVRWMRLAIGIIASEEAVCMGMYLNPGNGLFQRTLNGRFYVDKTGLARFLNGRMGTDEALVCMSRPRRFGKSVDADMLVAYYSKDVDSRAQFEGLQVSRDPSFEEHLNAHDVIKLDMTQVMPLAEGVGSIARAAARLVIDELRANWPALVAEGESSLPRALSSVWAGKGSGFVFVIDEWDCVMREAQGDEVAQRAYLDFLRDVLKGRPYVEAAYMTGILPIRKYGQHSALNVFTEYSMADPKDIPHLFGFNADEVERLCGRFGMDYAEMARWYDGYVLGTEHDRVHVYNPRSVAGALASGKYSSFWTSTETYEALQRYIDIDFDGVASDIVQMIDGVRIGASVEGFSNTMTDFRDKDDVYALLVHLGYLGYDQAARAVFVPNEEIRREFVNALRGGGRPGLARLVRESRELLRATVDGDGDYVADVLDRAHSWAAVPRWYNDEQALRAAVKFAYIAALDDYLRVDELPGGKGFADVAFVPKPESALPPMIVELKWDRPADAAIDQIEARGYPAAFNGLAGECLLVGVTYGAKDKRHTCQIKRVTLG